MTDGAGGRLGSDRRIAWCLAAVVAVSAILNTAHLAFPLGFHADEPVKVESILTGRYNFYHPLLMLQLVRMANAVAGHADLHAVVLLGRVIMALCGVVTVILSFVLARRVLPVVIAMGVALAVAVSPTMVIHAHYLKEDTVLTMCLVAASICFVRFAEQQTRGRGALLAVTTGLALSSHYKAVLLIPLFLVAPVLGAVGSRSTFYRRLLGVGLGAGAVFLAINWPLFIDPDGFAAGAMSEASHAVAGEDARIRWTDYYLGFHLVRSLGPGMGWTALLLAAIGVAITVIGWKRAPFQDRWLMMFIAVFYLVHEVSPLKPWPDYSRYVLPTVPMLLYFAGLAVSRLWSAPAVQELRIALVAIVVAAGIGIPLYQTIRLVDGLGSDTRTRAADWVRAHQGTVVADRYAIDQSTGPVGSVAPLEPGDLTDALDPVKLSRQGVSFIAVSSFVYDRFAVGAILPDQAPEVYAAHRRYQELFALPYVEFAPAYRSFAFSNPVVRIIDLRPSSAPPMR